MMNILRMGMESFWLPSTLEHTLSTLESAGYTQTLRDTLGFAEYTWTNAIAKYTRTKQVQTKKNPSIVSQTREGGQHLPNVNTL